MSTDPAQSAQPVTAINKDESARRYILTVDGAEAGYAAYANLPDGVQMFHATVVNPAYQGRGLSVPLIRAALDDARAAGRKIRPACSAVAHFVEKNPEYQDLVA